MHGPLDLDFIRSFRDHECFRDQKKVGETLQQVVEVIVCFNIHSTLWLHILLNFVLSCTAKPKTQKATLIYLHIHFLGSVLVSF